MKGTKKEPHSHPRTVKPFSEEILSMQRFALKKNVLWVGCSSFRLPVPPPFMIALPTAQKQAFSYCFNWISIVL
jgi:hypothetical protein